MFNNKKIIYVKIESEVIEEKKQSETPKKEVKMTNSENTIGAMLLNHIFSSSEKSENIETRELASNEKMN